MIPCGQLESLEVVANICVDATDATIFGTYAPAAGRAGCGIHYLARPGRVDKVSLCVEEMGSQLYSRSVEAGLLL